MLIHKRTICLLLVTAGLLGPGCALNSDRLALEKQLRKKEAQVRDLTSRLNETEQLLADQDKELSAIRNRKPSSVSLASASNQGGPVAPEVSAAFGSVVDLRIHELTSGIVDPEAAEPVLNLVVQPLDSEGELVKVAGELTVRVSSASDVGAPRQLVSKKFSVTDSRRLWTRGLVASGFSIQSPLPAEQLTATMHSENGQVIAEVTLDLGLDRQYTASLSVTP